MNKALSLAALFAALTLAGCSATRGGSGNPEVASSKKVAVISLLGQNFHGIHVGTVVFENTSYDAPVADWKIDEIAEQTIVSQIARTGSRSATVLRRDAGLAARIEKTWNFLRGYDKREIVDLAAKQGADTVVVVLHGTSDNWPFHKPGYGFYERTILGSSQRCVYSMFAVYALSTDDGRKLGGGSGLPCDAGEKELAWKDGFDKYSDEERRLLRRKTEENVKQNVLKALAEVGY